MIYIERLPVILKILRVYLSEHTTKLKSLSLIKCPKLITENCLSIGLTSLDSLKMNNCSEFKNIFDLSTLPKLERLSLIGCSALTTFDSSSTGLINLEISNCSQLLEHQNSNLSYSILLQI
ncbi:hypothetical protein GLOIN_2v1589080 [Rhizophagus clarus]|uniref:Uncharacterized protein n=1 Tax=Rhizophagus clarus TaxID=94130 RepID=A0A8H3QS37_9GLOM|nr:hypothetical protein GLOIN_2v1589080 [Rhizophagus clarus]